MLKEIIRMGFMCRSENPSKVTNYESALPYESTNLRMKGNRLRHKNLRIYE